MKKIDLSTFISIIGIPITIIGILISSWFSYKALVQSKELSSKELTCTITDGRALILKLTNNNKFKILYGEQEIQNPVITSISIGNTGGMVIENSDFIIPFSIVFGSDDVILSVSVNSSINEHITEEIIANSVLQSNKLSISGFILNPGESFNFDIISDGTVSLKFDYRFNGISGLNIVEQRYVGELVAWRKSPSNGLNVLFIVSIVCFVISAVALIYLIVHLVQYHFKSKKLYSELNAHLSALLEEENKTEDTNNV